MPAKDAGHARRGARDPDIAARIAARQAIPAGTEPDFDPGDSNAEEAAMSQEPYEPEIEGDEPLFPGDSMTAKAGYTFTVEGENAWNTFESTTTIQPGESELAAFERLNAQVNTRLMDASADLEVRITEANEQRAAARRARRIVPTE